MTKWQGSRGTLQGLLAAKLIPTELVAKASAEPKAAEATYTAANSTCLCPCWKT